MDNKDKPDEIQERSLIPIPIVEQRNARRRRQIHYIRMYLYRPFINNTFNFPVNPLILDPEAEYEQRSTALVHRYPRRRSSSNRFLAYQPRNNRRGRFEVPEPFVPNPPRITPFDYMAELEALLRRLLLRPNDEAVVPYFPMSPIPIFNEHDAEVPNFSNGEEESFEDEDQDYNTL